MRALPGEEAKSFPPDIDTTSLALTVLKPNQDIIFSVMDELLQYLDTDGIVQVGLFLT